MSAWRDVLDDGREPRWPADSSLPPRPPAASSSRSAPPRRSSAIIPEVLEPSPGARARQMRTRRILEWAGALLLVGLGFFICGWVPYFLGGIATTRRFQFNDKANAGLTPASFNLPFEEVSFQAA